MSSKSEKKFRETMKLFYWSLGVAAVSAFMVYSGFYWFHSIFMIAVGGVFGPVAALVALFMCLMAIAIRLDQRK